MKKLILILFAITLFSCSKQEVKPVDYAIFRGKIENLTEGKISLWNSNKIFDDIIVNKDSTFLDTIINVKSGFYTFKYGKEQSKIYLKPGYNINLSLDPKQFDESIKYSGEGSYDNNYLAQKFLKEVDLNKFLSYRNLGALNEADFVRKMDSVKNSQLTYLEERKDLDSTLKNLEEGDIIYGWANHMHNYEAYKRYISKNDDYKVSENYPDFSKDLNIEDESLIDVMNYKMYLQSYYYQKFSEELKNEEADRQITYLELISKNVKSQKIINALLYSDAKYGITYTGELQKYYDLFMANSTDEENKKDITDKYNKLIKLSKGNVSPKFVDYENYKGGTTSLDDLKGKYVYIDVWATWCGPCKREIPYLKEITKKYDGKNITFVSMSIDKKEAYDAWRKMVDDEKLEGVQLFAPNDWKSDFVTDYGIMGIPRFILIDPEGNIVNANAPRPSSKELIKLLTDLKV